MTLIIELPDERTSLLAAKAQAQGLSAEQYALRVLDHNLESDLERPPIWEVILGNMSDVPREAFADLPKDGASQVDHYLYGHPKRDR